MTRVQKREQPVVPTPDMIDHVKDLLRHMDDERVRFVLMDREEDSTIDLSEEIFDIFRQILIDLSQNRAVSILPMEHELTTFQAADVLNVSRPHIIKLIERDELPCRMVGSHRRIQLKDLLDYKARKSAEGKKAREELTRIAQEHGVGY